MWLVLAGAVVVVLGGAVPLTRGAARRRALRAEFARVRALHSRLGSYVETTAAGDDARAAELLARASERWHTCGSLLASAGAAEELAVAAETAEEGLRQVALACRRLGIAGPGDE